MMMVLENLNRILGSCFPPLVILGAIGALLHLYQAIRIRNRNRLVGPGSFLALLLFFMLLNRIFNPAVISYRYVIGIAVLTSGWSVRLIQLGWKYCPPCIRRWRPLILFALVFGICLGGILKEMRISKRTRRETEIIRFLRSDPNRNNGTNKLLIGQNERWNRILASAGRSDFQAALALVPGKVSAEQLQILGRFADEIYCIWPSQSIVEEFFVPVSSLIPVKTWRKLYQKKIAVYSTQLSGAENGVMPPRLKQDVVYENFENGVKFPDNAIRQELRKRGVGFAESPSLLPKGWMPNHYDGYRGENLRDMELTIIPDGISGPSLYFCGNTMGSLMLSRTFSVGPTYYISFAYRGTPGSCVAVSAYFYTSDGHYLSSDLLRRFICTKKEETVLIQVHSIPTKAKYFQLVLQIGPGEIQIDNFIVMSASFFF